MNKRRELFCREYLRDLNSTQAAIRAGYSPKTANPRAARLLANVSIRERIAELKAQSLARPETQAGVAAQASGFLITRLRISVMSSMAKRMPSRPRPESFTPP
jgi:hypothetical protein